MLIIENLLEKRAIDELELVERARQPDAPATKTWEFISAAYELEMNAVIQSRG